MKKALFWVPGDRGRHEPGVCAPPAKAQGQGPKQAQSKGEEPSPHVHTDPGRALHEGTAAMQGGGLKLRQPREVASETEMGLDVQASSHLGLAASRGQGT